MNKDELKYLAHEMLAYLSEVERKMEACNYNVFEIFEMQNDPQLEIMEHSKDPEVKKRLEAFEDRCSQAIADYEGYDWMLAE